LMTKSNFVGCWIGNSAGLEARVGIEIDVIEKDASGADPNPTLLHARMAATSSPTLEHPLVGADQVPRRLAVARQSG
jgi:hypothetical protein